SPCSCFTHGSSFWPIYGVGSAPSGLGGRSKRVREGHDSVVRRLELRVGQLETLLLRELKRLRSHGCKDGGGLLYACAGLLASGGCDRLRLEHFGEPSIRKVDKTRRSRNLSLDKRLARTHKGLTFGATKEFEYALRVLTNLFQNRLEAHYLFSVVLLEICCSARSLSRSARMSGSVRSRK